MNADAERYSRSSGTLMLRGIIRVLGTLRLRGIIKVLGTLRLKGVIKVSLMLIDIFRVSGTLMLI